MRRARITACGAYLPRRVVTNHDLAQTLDTSDAWIAQRTGIHARHIAGDGESTSFMAAQAAERALKNAKLAGTDIDMIVLATTTPDQTFPATAVTVQDAIGMSDRGFAFDVQAVCSGFVYGLAVADRFIRSGGVNRALVIGAERFSNMLDWSDRSTCVLFGDGAGAVVVEAETDGAGADRGILSTHLHSDGATRHLLHATGGPGTTQTVGHLHMDGKEVFRHAVTRMGEVVGEALAENRLRPQDIRWLIPHQANKRIIDALTEKLALPPERVVLTVDRHGNTSAASIPLALAAARDDGRIQPGDLMLLAAMGAGFTWGAAVVRW